MTFTISHPDGSETTATEEVRYYDADSKTVYTNQRRRQMPRLVKKFVSEAWYITTVQYQGDLVETHMVPSELEELPRGEFVIRDQTGAKVKIRAVHDKSAEAALNSAAQQLEGES
jgi:hypothetical protein